MVQAWRGPDLKHSCCRCVSGNISYKVVQVCVYVYVRGHGMSVVVLIAAHFFSGLNLMDPVIVVNQDRIGPDTRTRYDIATHAGGDKPEQETRIGNIHA